MSTSLKDKFNTASAEREIDSAEFNEKLEEALHSGGRGTSLATDSLIAGYGGLYKALQAGVVTRRTGMDVVTIAVETDMSGQQMCLDIKAAALKATHKHLDSIKVRSANSVDVNIKSVWYEAVPSAQSPVVARTKHAPAA